MSNNLISLIIPTIHRVSQLDALLHSITKSTYKDYEVIVIDQNKTGMLDHLIFKYKDSIAIQHIRVDFAGASRARNHGLQYANGSFLMFPDDDAEIYPDTLALAKEYLLKMNADVLFGKCVDRTFADSVGKFSKKSGYLSLKNHENMFIEVTMFIRTKIYEEYLFDETFGVGTFYGSSEAYDLVLRMLYGNVVIFYTPDVKVYHPSKVTSHSEISEKRRVLSYSCGFAHLCVKHKLYRKYFTRLFKVVLYIPYTVIFASRKTRYYLSELIGLLTGIIVR